MSSNAEVGAYFYPLTQSCFARRCRALDIGKDIGVDQLEVPDELELAQQAQPLFEGHDQPRTYCLGEGDNLQTTWDDSQDSAIFTQAAMAASHGLSYFIVDSYDGLRDGEPVREMQEAGRIISRALSMLGRIGMFKYARMEVLEGPRAVLPVPKNELGSGFYAEPGRGYDITPEAARFIVDCNIEHWRDPAYLLASIWRPYLSLMAPAFPPSMLEHEKHEQLKTFVDTLYDYALKRYDVWPFLVGVLRSPADAERWAFAGVDGMTQYCNLPDFSAGMPQIQQYEDRTRIAQQDWHKIYEGFAEDYILPPFVPSASIGWDASPRGEQGHSLQEVSGLHPYTPIVVGNTPDAFAAHLRNAIKYAKANVPEGQQFVTIFAWNEIGEGATLLPRLRPDKTVDKSYLKAAHEVIRTYGHCAMCEQIPGHADRMV
jgi:hypothetical protein